MKTILILAALCILSVSCMTEETMPFELEAAKKFNVTDCLHEAGILSTMFDKTYFDHVSRKGFPVFVDNAV